MHDVLPPTPVLVLGQITQLASHITVLRLAATSIGSLQFLQSRKQRPYQRNYRHYRLQSYVNAERDEGSIEHNAVDVDTRIAHVKSDAKLKVQIDERRHDTLPVA